MVLGLFLLGALGALITVYLAKQEVIPEFRPLFDITEKEREVLEHRKHIKKTEGHIDGIQQKLEDDSCQDSTAVRLTTVLETSLSELNGERTRLENLERHIKQGQVISRSLGFAFYILLGGVFGALLADKVEVAGFSGDFPDFFKSMLIGATWTTYLSVIGFRTGQKRTEERIEQGKEESSKKFENTKREIMDVIAERVTKAEEEKKMIHADEIVRTLSEKFDDAKNKIDEDWDMTRQMVKQETKALL